MKQEKLFENLFPAGATEHLGRATQRRNILSDAVISIYILCVSIYKESNYDDLWISMSVSDIFTMASRT